MKKRLSLFIGICLMSVLIVTSVLAACTVPQTTPTTTPTGTATPTPGTTTTPVAGEVKEASIGLIASATGAYAANGVPIRDTIRAAVKLYNDAGGFVVNGQTYKLKLIEYDDRTDPKRSVAGMTMMKDLYDIKMVMSMGSMVTLAAQPVAESNHIIQANLAAADDATREGLQWSWSFTTPTKVRVLAIVPYVAEVMKAKSLAVITEGEAFCEAQRTQILAECKRLGVTVASDIRYEIGTIDFSTIIARTRAANPDVLWVNGTSGTNILIVKQIAQAGYHVELVGSLDLPNDDLFKTTGAAADGIVAGGQLSYFGYKNNQYPEKMMEIMGTDMELYMKAANNYIADYGDTHMQMFTFGPQFVSSFVEVMKKAGTVDDAQKLRDTYEGMEWQDWTMQNKVLSNHRVRQFLPVYAYYQSDKGANNFKLLSIVGATDDTQSTWTSEVVGDFPTVAELRISRGY